MEKRNIVEQGRTPEQLGKQAEDDNLMKAASSFERGAEKDEEKKDDGKN
jgi:hypothetical protein